MQPAVPVNTTILVYIALVAMNTNIGRKEQVIHMYLLAVCLCVTCCSAHTDALADGTGAAGYEQRQRKCKNGPNPGGTRRVLKDVDGNNVQDSSPSHRLLFVFVCNMIVLR